MRQPPCDDVNVPAGGFQERRDGLAGQGIEIAVGFTGIYQTNTRGGLSTSHKAGRLSGSYDIEIAADLERTLGAAGLGLFVHGKGGWPDTKGIDETMVGSIFGVNADAVGHRSLDVVEVVFEWNPLDGFLAVRIGKMDFAGVFDASEYANDETSQFLNGALVNNPTISLPDYCLGVILIARPTEFWFWAVGVGDAEADGRTTGFRTAFDGDNYFFCVLETGLLAELDSPHGPLPGNYRLGLWYDSLPGAPAYSDELYRDDAGVYVSVDQMFLRENDNPEENQGLGIFGRCGYAEEERNDLAGFWSVGVQYQGLPDGRDEDVLGLGFAQGVFSDRAGVSVSADSESVMELYYRIHAAPWAAVSPSIQYIRNPGGNRDADDAVIVGVRAQVSF